jgi:hypothetical protein
MATLQATTATSMTVNNNTVWTAANDGSTNGADTGLDAGSIWGYNHLDFDIPARLSTTHTLTGGDTGTFYPMIFTEDDWTVDSTSHAMTMDIKRTNPNTNASGAGAFIFKVRYKGTNWGYHQNHYEVLEHYGSGSAYPFVAAIAQPGTTVWLAVWLRGGYTYDFQYGSRAGLFDTSLKSRKGGVVGANWGNPFGSSDTGDTWYWENNYGVNTPGVSTQTTLSLPTNGIYYQQHLCSKGYNLGLSDYRWTDCFVQTKDISSDARYKDNFGVSFGMAFLEKLNPVRFQRIGDTDRKFHHGFIAQEVGEALQELGYTSIDFAGFDDRNPDHLALMYDQFIPVIINAIQEEENEMSLLKQRVRQLEDRLNGDV